MKKNILLLFLFAFILRVILTFIVPVTGDACYHYLIAQYIAETWTIPTFEMVTGTDGLWYPPLFYLVGAIFYSINPILLFFVPILSSLLGIYYTYKLVEENYDKNLAENSLWIAIFLPVILYSAATGFVEVLLFFTSAAALYYYHSYLKNKEKKNILLTILFCALSGLVHYNGLVLLLIPFHLMLYEKNLKKPLLVLFAIILLLSPWYLRNWALFGHPFYAVLSGYNAPMEPSNTIVDVVSKIFSFEHWQTVYFEFWIGAPNSGGDALEKLFILGNKQPFIYLAFFVWFVVAIIFTLLGIIGLLKIKNIDKKLFLFYLFLVLVLLLATTFRPYARILTPSFPIVILIFSLGYQRIIEETRIKHFGKIILILMLVILSLNCFFYAYTYKVFFEPYITFYTMINNSELEGLFLTHEDPLFAYYAPSKEYALFSYVPYGKRVPPTILEEENYWMELNELGIKYVCCTERNMQGDLPITKVCKDYEENPILENEIGYCSEITGPPTISNLS